jgi:hypothetical protein
MDQSAQQQNEAIAIQGTAHVKNGSNSNTRKPELNDNNTFPSSARPFVVKLEDYYAQPNNPPTSGLERSHTSSHAPHGYMEKNDASYQKIPRPWASKFGEMEPTQLDVHSLKQIPGTTAFNGEPLLRWYGEPIAQGPYHNTGSVRNGSVVPSHDGTPRAASATHAPSQNSAEWGSSGQQRE